MLLYDIDCELGDVHEAFLPYTPNPHVTCPEHNCPAYREPCAGRTVGVMPSRPLVFERRTGDKGAFHSNAEVRAYLEKNPGHEIVETSSRWTRDFIDSVEVAAEADSKKLGFNDRDDHQKHMRRARRKKIAAA